MTYPQIWSLYAVPLAQGLVLTIQLAVVGVLIALPLGLLLAAVRQSGIPVARVAVVTAVDIVRGIPELLILFIIYFGLANVGFRLSAFASVTCMLVLVGSCYSSEIFRAGIESVDKGQVEAAHALGLGRLTTYTRVVLPQAFLLALPALGNYLILAIKTTALGFTIGLLELMGKAAQGAAATYQSLPLYLLACTYYFLVCWPLSLVVRRLERVTKSYQ